MGAPYAVVSGAYQDSSSNKFIGYKDPAYGNVMQACNVGSSGGNAFYVVHNGITKYSYGAMIYIAALRLGFILWNHYQLCINLD